MKPKILILGGTSFIGFNLSILLYKKYDVTILTSLNKKKKIKKKRYSFLKKLKIKIIKLDFLSSKIKYANFKKYDCIINCIGWTKNYNSEKYDYNKIEKKNLTLFRKLFLIFKKNKLKKFIEIGTSFEYGNRKKKCKERDLCNPTLPYGKLKLKNCLKLEKISKTTNTNIYVIRVFSIFGYLDRPEKFIESLKKKNPIIIKNPDLPQDFVSVNYLAKMINKIIKKKILKNNFEIYNCCSGSLITPNKIINFLIKKNLLKNNKLTIVKKKKIKQKLLLIGNRNKILNKLKLPKENFKKELVKYF